MAVKSYLNSTLCLLYHFHTIVCRSVWELSGVRPSHRVRGNQKRRSVFFAIEETTFAFTTMRFARGKMMSWLKVYLRNAYGTPLRQCWQSNHVANDGEKSLAYWGWHWVVPLGCTL